MMYFPRATLGAAAIFAATVLVAPMRGADTGKEAPAPAAPAQSAAAPAAAATAEKKTPPDMASGRRNWYGEERSLVAERPNFLAGFIFAGGRQRFRRGRGRDAAQLYQLRPWGFP